MVLTAGAKKKSLNGLKSMKQIPVRPKSRLPYLPVELNILQVILRYTKRITIHAGDS